MSAYRKLVQPRLRRRLPAPGSRIFNSGVMLIDLERWRSRAIQSALAVLMPLFAGINGEQLVLNVLFPHFDVLDWHWNFMGMFMPIRLPRMCIEGARILHWTWDNKPWRLDKPREYQEHKNLFDFYAPRQKCSALDYSPAGS